VTHPLGLLGLLALALALCAVAAALLRRFAPAALGNVGRGLPLRVLQRTALGPRHGVALLQVDERVLVVALGEDGARLLTELDGDARARALTAAPAPPAAGVTSAPLGELRALLAGLGVRPRPGAVRRGRWGWLVAALLLLAPVAHAQAPAGAAAATPPGVGALVPPPVRVPGPAKGPVASMAPARPRGAIAGPVVTPPPLPEVDIRVGEGKDQIRLSGAVGLVVFLGVLTLLPALFLLMTSFTRILIVMHFLRSALGTQTTPPNQLLVALAILLTGVVMNPVLEETHRDALQPYFDGRITQAEAYSRALVPFREFMLRNVREQDLASFARMSGIEEVEDAHDLPTLVVVSAFVVSELRTSFQMGFVIYLPFVVVDVVVASVLMSLGMFMLPPIMISMPIKLLLFVLADGWTLIVQNLVASFR
jgi:flagellar biosynthetic protein FliP